MLSPGVVSKVDNNELHCLEIEPNLAPGPKTGGQGTMHKRFSAMCVMAFASLIATPPAHSGAWTQSKGKGLVIANIAHSGADRRFDDVGNSVAIRDFRKTEIRVYAEYGLTDWATLIAQPEWRHKETGPDRGEEVSGLGRVDAGMRLRVWKNDTSVFSLQASGRMPGASDRLAPANGGDTDWEADARLLYGRGFPVFGRHAFTDMQLGYRFRFGDPADELRLDLTTGIDVTPKILALFQSFNSVSVGTAKGPFLPTREHKLSAGVVYRFDEAWSLQAGGLLTVGGRNTIEERGIILGLWRSF